MESELTPVESGRRHPAKTQIPVGASKLRLTDVK
jgi:hypothetical protein